MQSESTFRSSLLPAFVLLATATIAASTAHAQTTTTPVAVSPAQRLALEGSSYTHYPLGRRSARMQTLHDDVPGGTVIQGHGYRRDAIGVIGVVAGLAVDVQVTLSMAPHPAAQASGSFAQNIGSNPVVVLPRQVVAFPATDRPAHDPAATWELTIPYSTPFVVPPQGGTLCVDVEVFGNITPNGANQNVSLYLDAHQQYSNGDQPQPGYRFGSGCPAPGNTADCYANLDYWRLGAGGAELEVAIRNGVADDGSGAARAFVTFGTGLANWTWPGRPDCTFWSSSEVWFALPGTMTTTGRYDGTLTGLPLLPHGYRLYCQAGSIDLGNLDVAFGDVSTFVTPPAAVLPVPVQRVANGSDVAATSGSVSRSVPVMAFF